MTADRLPGVYVVCLDPDVTGAENIAWAFRDEIDADALVAVLAAEYGEGRAWSTWEPVAYSLDDPDLASWLRDREIDPAALRKEPA